ncbi:MAG: MBL fold metallo-hydrolase [Chloroflexaceae bacterium]|nr:MBL fold metallo-hydrolase [Chloroflexaceae bacterium]
MKRRQLLGYLGTSALTAAATVSFAQKTAAQGNAGGLTVQWLGHTCFLFSGGGLRILLNPFQPSGCTAGYRPPQVEADLVLISSRLLDEGAAGGLPGNPKVLFEPGVYQADRTKIQGIGVPHDREGGRRFGVNVVWRWEQGGIDILHMGGAASRIEFEQKILMGTPDLALIPVGGGPKAYNAQEAKQAMEVLKPKVVIPTQFRTQAADVNTCDLVAVDAFLELTKDLDVRRLENNSLTLRSQDLPKQGTLIRVLSDRTLLKT